MQKIVKLLTQNKYFVTGIDTNVGKTIVTGLIAKTFHQSGYPIITQKLAQTGCRGISEDILKHREIAKMNITDDDQNGITCAYVFQYPASPHLAAQLENAIIDVSKITENTNLLLQKYNKVIIEGAGGVFVPITPNYFTIDYIVEQKLPVIIVTTPKLGSINHTLLTIDACRKRKIEITALIYNTFEVTSVEIKNDSLKIFQNYLNEHSPKTVILEIDELY